MFALLLTQCYTLTVKQAQMSSMNRPLSKDKAGTYIRFLLYQEHEVTHVGVGKDREFSCDKCGKMLTSAQSLTYHLYTHEGRADFPFLKRFNLMACLHCWRRTRVPTRIRIPNLMATLYCTETVPIAQIKTLISAPYFYTGQESESEFVPESVSSNVNDP